MAAKKHNLYHYVITAIYYTARSLVGASISIVIAIFGLYLFRVLASPLNLIFGLPLALGGGGYALNKIFTVLLSIFSPEYNKGVCIVCFPFDNNT